MRTSLISFPWEASKADAAVAGVKSVLQSQYPSLVNVQQLSLGESNGFLVVLSTAGETASGATFTLRFYQAQGLFSLVGEIIDGCDEAKNSNNSSLANIQEKLQKELKLESMERLPNLNRASSVPNYFPRSDDRILAYDFDSIVVHDKSEFQGISFFDYHNFKLMIVFHQTSRYCTRPPLAMFWSWTICKTWPKPTSTTLMA